MPSIFFPNTAITSDWASQSLQAVTSLVTPDVDPSSDIRFILITLDKLKQLDLPLPSAEWEALSITLSQFINVVNGNPQNFGEIPENHTLSVLRDTLKGAHNLKTKRNIDLESQRQNFQKLKGFITVNSWLSQFGFQQVISSWEKMTDQERTTNEGVNASPVPLPPMPIAIPYTPLINPPVSSPVVKSEQEPAFSPPVPKVAPLLPAPQPVVQKSRSQPKPGGWRQWIPIVGVSLLGLLFCGSITYLALPTLASLFTPLPTSILDITAASTTVEVIESPTPVIPTITNTSIPLSTTTPEIVVTPSLTPSITISDTPIPTASTNGIPQFTSQFSENVIAVVDLPIVSVYNDSNGGELSNRLRYGEQIRILGVHNIEQSPWVWLRIQTLDAVIDGWIMERNPQNIPSIKEVPSDS